MNVRAIAATVLSKVMEGASLLDKLQIYREKLKDTRDQDFL